MKMTLFIKLFSLFLIVHICHINAVPHRFVEVENDSGPSFFRGSVENIPSDDTKKANLKVIPLDKLVNDDVMQFSRAAVESVPKSIISQYLPLRSAVEHNPLNDEDQTFEKYSRPGSRKQKFLNIVYYSRQSKASNYDAYIIPDSPDETNPLFFRGESPYQKIIDVKTYEPSESQHDHLKVASLKKKDYKVVCFTTNWSFYRKGEGKFVPENLNYDLCTDIIYTFASLDPEELIMTEFDPWADVENKLYSRTVKLGVAKGKQVFLGIGGWTDSTNGKYSKMVSDKKLRANFIENAIPFLKRFSYTGLHVDWNYPVCPQSDCKRGNPSDKMYFTQFIKELQIALQQANLGLSISLSGYKEIINEAYDLVALSKYVDFMTVMTFDYHGAWEPETGHVSPLYGSNSDKYPQYNTNYTIQLLLKLGAAREKIIMGVPFYGQSFSLSSNKNGFNAPVDGPGRPGEFTVQPGMLSYYEICSNLRMSNFKKGIDSSGNSGPYITDNQLWAGYDDIDTVNLKAKYVVENDLGGISAWTVDLDDFNNVCCQESFPLLRSINQGLGKAVTSTGNDCTKPSIVTPPPAIMTSTEDSGYGGIPNQSTTANRPTQTQSTTRRSTTSSPWWTQPTTANRPTQTQSTTRRSTTKRPVETTAIPSPVNVMPVVIENEICQSGSFKGHPENCENYLVCARDQWVIQYCPSGLFWNNEHRHCDWPQNVKCNEQKSTTTSSKPIISTTTRKSSTSTTTRKQKTSTTTRRPVTSTTTRRPITTSTQKPVRKTTVTMRTTTVNRRPTTTARPTYYETTTMYYTTLAPTSSTNKPIKKQTKCNNGQYYSHKDCGRYYICTNFKKVPMFCPDGLQWSTMYKICDYEQNVKCVSKKKFLKLLKTQNEKTGAYTALLLKASVGDVCNSAEFFSYPGSCSTYLQCEHSRLIKRQCPNGLEWDDSINSCNWPNGKCQNDPGIEEFASEEDIDNELSNEESFEFKPSSTTKAPPSFGVQLETIPVHEHVEPLNGKYKMICYFTNWAWYRPGDGKYLPDDIDTNLCTHVVYGFAVLSYDDLTIRSHDSWADIDNKFYERVVELKKKGISVTLALGGWNDSAGDKYSRLVRNPSARSKFIRHAIEFIEKYGFDGLDLDWEYPVCWQVDCKKGFADEKQHFASFVKEISQAFKPRGLLLSAAVSPSKTVIDAGYDVASLSEHFDWIAVMCYDYHGQWDKKTGHVAPLYYHPQDDVDFFNTNYTINYWIKLGAPRHKIIMGMPLYGQSFTLADTKNNALNAKAPGAGQAGEFTRAAGFLAYYEICDRIFNKGWKVIQDPLGRMGPYAYNGNQWVSFDDQAMLKKKVEFIKNMGLGGGMVWALDLDDFRGTCGQGKHPLLKVIHDELQNDNEIDNEDNELPQPNEDNETPEVNQEIPETIEEVPESPIENEIEPDEVNEPIVPKPEDEETYEAENEEDIDEDHDSNEIDDLDGDYKVVCYFTNWAWYRPGIGKFKPEDIDAELCTHVVYAFAVLNRETLTIQPHDSWADIDNKFYEKVVELKQKGIAVTIGLGGWNDSAGDKYSRLVTDPSARKRFIKHVTEFIEKYNFDGLDLDYEYPVCWQVDCSKGKPEEKEGFADLVRELSAVFKPKGLLLSSAVSPSKKVIDAGYDIPTLSKYFDWISVMCYDYHGQWDKKTGHVAPMYVHPEDWEKTFNVNFTINYWIENGADPRKLVLGMPTYGQSFSLAERNNNGLNSQTYGGGEAGEETRARGFLSYYEICSRIQKNGWTVVKDSRGRMGPYAYNGDQWVSFDDVHMIRHKSEYVKALNLGGAMIWALDLDDFKNTCDCEEYPLLRTINRVLRKYPSPHNKCFLEKNYQTPTDEVLTKKPIYTERPSTSMPTTSRRTTQKTTKVPFYEVEDFDENYPDLEDEQNACSSGLKTFAVHNDCHKYYVCNHGNAIEMSCGNVLYWNRKSNSCDWPKNVECSNREEGSVNEIDPEYSTPQSVKPQSTGTKGTTKKPTTTTTSKPKPTKPPVITDPFIPTGNNEFKVVCYFTNWAWYRPGIGKYKPDDIDTTLCTHIVYGFAVLNGETLTIRTHDSWADIDNNFYTRVSGLKEKGVKVSIGLGGWNDSAGDKYGRLILNPAARKKFIVNVIEFMKKYDFQGLDLDYEYPVCIQVDCTKGKPEEKQGFAEFVKELHDAFKPEGFLLSAAVSPSKKVIDAGYDIPKISEYFDWIAVMCYDYHGQWDKKTGHVAPLYEHPEDWEKTFNANFSINYWISRGAHPKKLVMGMPTYGQSFTLEKVSNNGLNAIAPGPGQAGEFTRSAGFLSFYEICQKLNSGGWTVVKDPLGKMGPYAYKDRQWVSYDDVNIIRQKTKFVKDMRLGGAMIWYKN